MPQMVKFMTVDGIIQSLCCFVVDENVRCPCRVWVMKVKAAPLRQFEKRPLCEDFHLGLGGVASEMERSCLRACGCASIN